MLLQLNTNTTITTSNIVMIVTYCQALQWKLQTSLSSKLSLLFLASISILLRQTNSIWVILLLLIQIITLIIIAAIATVYRWY